MGSLDSNSVGVMRPSLSASKTLRKLIIEAAPLCCHRIVE